MMDKTALDIKDNEFDPDFNLTIAVDTETL